MLYSVFNWQTRQYDYYRGSGPSLGDKIKPRAKGNPDAARGMQLEALLPVLPDDAIRIGTGRVAEGQIAVHPSEAQYAGFGQSTGSGSTWLMTGMLVVGSYIIYRLLVGTAKRF